MPNINNKIIISFKLYDQNLNALLSIDGDDKTVGHLPPAVFKP